MNEFVFVNLLRTHLWEGVHENAEGGFMAMRTFVYKIF